MGTENLNRYESTMRNRGAGEKSIKWIHHAAGKIIEALEDQHATADEVFDALSEDFETFFNR